MDLFAKARDYSVPTGMRNANLYPYFIPFSSGMEPEAQADGRHVLMFGSNNYLGLTTHPAVVGAAREALGRFGTSCTGSRFANGTLTMHHDLEDDVAAFLGKEAALVFTTGYQANLGAIAALAGRGDVVILDRGDHASITDGALLGHGTMARYHHNDLNRLEELLAQHSPHSAVLVVVDGVFSMEGDLAPLPEICALTRRYGARLLVDDAHGIGVVGGSGRGSCEHFSVTDQVDLITGTFSKSLASIGGFVAGPRAVIDYIRHKATAMIFSASMSPPCVAAAHAALRILDAEPERRLQLRAAVTRLRDGLRRLDLRVGDAPAAIVPVVIGDSRDLLSLWRSLFDAGLYVNPAIPPAVEPGAALLRASCMATHTSGHVDKALAVFTRQIQTAVPG